MMNEHDRAASSPAPLILPFPTPGKGLQLAYRELHLAQYGTDEQKEALGDITTLPRPWAPETVTQPRLRHELWTWLEGVVTWLNHEYTWDVAGIVPTCWPKHPHLVHEIAVLADQRRRARLALTSDALEEWHRYVLPAFVDRMKLRLRSHCEDRHQDWPGRARHTRHAGKDERTSRERLYLRDEATLRQDAQWQPPEPERRLQLVDQVTGEIHD
ncbi:hypothetical protein M3697_16405 [Janibacter melonis]|uniref:hypothetical protein n=1 Tax=Janibacter melonis TaxID=262209 RepID=UPI0020449573|nr:hypothetical protein [Janibacter melonis]MCM3556669.1 hypothetical protein [Janibacter melonis]